MKIALIKSSKLQELLAYLEKNNIQLQIVELESIAKIKIYGILLDDYKEEIVSNGLVDYVYDVLEI